MTAALAASGSAADIASFEAWLAYIRRRLREKWDAWILVTGKPGVGKSMTSNFLAHKIDEAFTLDRTFWSGRSLIWGSENAPPYSALVWDEIIDGGLSAEAITRENKQTLKHLITGRSYNLATLACAPKLRLFQGFMKEDRAEWWIHLPARGIATFHHVIDWNPYPGAKPYYKQKFTLRGIPMPPAAEVADYERRKREWRTLYHRDSEKFVAEKTDEDKLKANVERLARKLSWLPDAVQGYAETFPGHKGSLKPWEKAVRARIRG